MPLPVDAAVQVALQQLVRGRGRVEVVVRHALAARVEEGADVLGEGGLAGHGQNREDPREAEARPGQHKAGQVQRAEDRPAPVLVAPARV